MALIFNALIRIKSPYKVLRGVAEVCLIFGM